MITVAILRGSLILAVAFLVYKLWYLEEEIIETFSGAEKKRNLLRFILCR